MPIRHAIWKVAAQPQPLAEATLASEQLLESMIVAAPQILSDEWMLIGRQELTTYGGRVDLLAIAPDGGIVLIELKREKTPRDVVAQALDYASWVEKLRAEDIVAIYRRFAPQGNLAVDFKARFGVDLDEEALNESHQIIIVGAALDPGTERIVAYLSDRDIPINVLFFQVFKHGADQFISRSWLIDPARTQVISVGSTQGVSEAWNGEFYASFGDGATRNWNEARQYGFYSAGGGTWYSKTLQLLKRGDRIWVRIPQVGYVGVGRVLAKPIPLSEFRLQTDLGEKPALDILKQATYHRDEMNDPAKSEYFVPVKWLDTLPAPQAIYEIGLFGNQNTVCQPTTPKWRTTVERLKQVFTNFDAPDWQSTDVATPAT